MSDVEKVVTWRTEDAAGTQELARRLAGLLRAGDLLMLSGDLGAGKTTFTQGLGQGLGVEGRVTSPTFVIARSHRAAPGGLPLVHVDAYRIESLEEIDALDLDTALAQAVTVVEWGEGKVEGLSADRLEVRITRPAGMDTPATESADVTGPAEATELADVVDLAGLDDTHRELTVRAFSQRWDLEQLAALGEGL